MNRRRLTRIRFIAPDARLLAMQQCADHLRVMHVGRRHLDAVNHLRLRIDADMTFHSIIPVAAFLGRSHFGIEPPRLVLRRRRGRKNGRIDNRPLRNRNAPALQVLIDLFEERRANALFFDHVTELADRRFVRRRFGHEIETHKADHRAAVVEHLFHRRIRQIEPLLQKINPKHPLQTDRRTTVARHRIIRSDHRDQLLPRYNGLHLLQKPLAARRSMQTFKRIRRKTKLFCHEGADE